MVLAPDVAGDGLDDIAGLTFRTAYSCRLASEEFAGVTAGTAKVGDVAIA